MPIACPACAQCSAREQENLEAVLVLIEADQCDCDTIDIGMDPCFSPGCECHCSRYELLSEDCALP